MEIDPEDVKAEIAAVKVAFAQVNARLGRGRGKPGGARPNILSRVSKADAPAAGDREQNPVRSYADYDRRSSRRFVNRDWNIARKRTAEGLFVDDQEDPAGGDDDVEPIRKRSHTDGPALQSQHNELDEGGEGQVQPIRKGHQVLYDPFDEANRSSEHMARPTQAGTARSRQHGDEASARAGRAFDQSRISFASSSQQRENRQQGRPPRSVRESETVPTLDRPGAGQKRRADADIRGAAKAGRFDEAAQPSQASVPIEDGEVEALPPAPQSHQEEFLVEKRPERHAPVPAKVLQRNRRMFGALLGHLDGAERQEKRFEQSAVMKRRKELEEHAAERARKDSMQAREAERRRQFEARRKDIATKRELLLQQNMKQAKLLCAEKIAYARGLLQFIRTETIPPILWEPAGVNKDVEKLFEQQAVDFKSWADEQLKKLRLDQQGMRERAEKQWADIDRIREERHNANLGRGKGGTGPAKVAPKAVRSSVMTAKDYQERAQHTRVQDAPEADAHEPGQGDDQDHAADDAEAHDETYLIPDADKAVSGATDAPHQEQPRSGRSATPERHPGAGEAAGSDDEADSKGEAQMEDAAPQRSSSDREAGGAGPQGLADSNVNVATEDSVQPGDVSDDSLSLSE